MKKTVLFLLFFAPVYIFSQIIDDFSDGNFFSNPAWSGTNDNFTVNADFQLQSKAVATSRSYLTTLSEAFENGVWEVWVKIEYNPSSSNYACFYIISDRENISTAVNGYYVQVGHTNDEVSLYVQEGDKKTKIIDGRDKILDSNPAEVKIKVTRDAQGNFALYSKLPSESEYVLEGDSIDMRVLGSKFTGLLYSNTSTTGKAYFFDDIYITGDKYNDTLPPVWTALEVVGSNQLRATFSEEMIFSNATFYLDNAMGTPSDIQIFPDGLSVLLAFSKHVEKGKIYTLTIENITDRAGNKLKNEKRQTGIIENPTIGDVIINEICFDAAENGAEYFEVYNNSDKVLDLGTMLFATRKADGVLNAGYNFPAVKLFSPREYFAFTPHADSIKNVYLPPEGANIFSSPKWYSLNNTSGDLTVINHTKDTVLDEACYSVRWHHPLVKNVKGVSLEKVNPILSGLNLSSWHSAATEVHYGTPGYENSQYRNLASQNLDDSRLWIEPKSFSPDNDGIEDLCLIRYKTDFYGYTANIAIFNAVGVKIKTIAANALLSSDGYVVWDGTNDNGKIVNPNIYIVYFEVVNVGKGIKKVQKLPVVVSTK